MRAHQRAKARSRPNRDSAGCLSALEQAVLARHHLLPIASAIAPLEVLVTREPLRDRMYLVVVALGEVEALSSDSAQNRHWADRPCRFSLPLSPGASRLTDHRQGGLAS